MANRTPKPIKWASLLEIRASHIGILHKKKVWIVTPTHAWHGRGDYHLMRVWALTYYTYAVPPANPRTRVFTTERGRK